MGYCLSRFDDQRLDENRIGLEVRSGDWFRITDGIGSGTAMDIDVKDRVEFFEAMDVLRAYLNDAELSPPSDEVKKQWLREEDDIEFLNGNVASIGEFTVEELRRALELLEKGPG